MDRWFRLQSGHAVILHDGRDLDGPCKSHSSCRKTTARSIRLQFGWVIHQVANDVRTLREMPDSRCPLNDNHVLLCRHFDDVTHMHAHTHTCTLTHAYTHTRTHTCTNTCTHAYTPPCTHTCTHGNDVANGTPLCMS